MQLAKWTGVVTNAGAGLLRGWVAKEILTVTRAEAGSGTVEETALMAQTGVAGGGKTASLTGTKKLDKAVQLRLQIAAPEAGYTLHQLGVWAALDGGEPALLALFQNLEGVPIPSRTDTPDFLYTFYGVVALNNSGAVEVLTDGNAWVTLETLHETVDAAKAELSDEIEAARKEAVRAAGEEADEKIAVHDLAEDAHAGQIVKAARDAIDRLKLELFTNTLTLPLTADSGEALLTSSGTPLLAVYHPDRSAAVLAELAALAGRLSGHIAETAKSLSADCATESMRDQAYADGRVLALERAVDKKIQTEKAEAITATVTVACENAAAQIAAHNSDTGAHPAFLRLAENTIPPDPEPPVPIP